jgi:hypothetical protein
MITKDLNNIARRLTFAVRLKYGRSYWSLSRQLRNSILWGDDLFKEFGGHVWLESETWQPSNQVNVWRSSILDSKFQLPSIKYLFLSNVTLLGSDACPILPGKRISSLSKRNSAKFFLEEPAIEIALKSVTSNEVEVGTVRDSKMTLSLVDRFDGNYGHWMCELLPKVALLVDVSRQYARDPHVLLRNNCPKFAVESIKLFFPDVRIEYYHSGLVVSNLLLVQNPTTGYSFLPSAIKIIRKPIMEYIKCNGLGQSGALFYLSRPSNGWRKILNESDLHSTFEYFGIEAINPGDFMFKDQVRLFSAASFLCGIHGSAFINMLFAENCSSLEFIGSYGDVTMASLSTNLGFRHSILQCKAVGDDTVVSVADVRDAISKCL